MTRRSYLVNHNESHTIYTSDPSTKMYWIIVSQYKPDYFYSECDVHIIKIKMKGELSYIYKNRQTNEELKEILFDKTNEIESLRL